uniref:Uncharacterized protein n=1 Tax=Arundo donax TaxID=35708 RepID=A0A0A8ZCL6_ARUDO
MSTSTRNSRFPCNPSLSSCLTAITSIVSGMYPLYTLPKPPSPSRFSWLKELVASAN